LWTEIDRKKELIYGTDRGEERRGCGWDLGVKSE